MSPLETALSYVQRGWCPIPLPISTKEPIGREWQKLRIDASNVDQFFSDSVATNIGLLFGPASNDLVDVDLDCREALVLADSFLPATGSEYGRPSKPRSHRLYKAHYPIEKAAF